MKFILTGDAERHDHPAGLDDVSLLCIHVSNGNGRLPLVGSLKPTPELIKVIY